MPIKSKAQQRAMYAAASGRGQTGIPKKVAAKFIRETPREAYQDMPERAEEDEMEDEMEEEAPKKKKRVVMRRKKKGGR